MRGELHDAMARSPGNARSSTLVGLGRPRAGCRSRLLPRVFVDKMTAKPVDGCVDDAIVSPAQQEGRDPRRHPHRSLHHFDRPRGMSACLGVVAVEGEPRRALQIAMHERSDTPFGDTLVEDDIESHAIRKRRRDDPVQHRAVFKAISLDRELAQPAPPRREPIDLDQPRPHLVGAEYSSGCVDPRFRGGE
jgi:hypothetical protein